MSEEFTLEHLGRIVERGVTMVVLHCEGWSGPCQRFLASLGGVAASLGFAGPIDGMAALSQLNQGKYFEGLGQNGHIICIDADKSSGIAKHLDVRHVPSMYYFRDSKDGRPLASKVGFALPDDVAGFVFGEYPKKDYVIPA